MKKVWEGRSYAFPPHYTPEYMTFTTWTLETSSWETNIITAMFGYIVKDTAVKSHKVEGSFHLSNYQLQHMHCTVCYISCMCYDYQHTENQNTKKIQAKPIRIQKPMRPCKVYRTYIVNKSNYCQEVLFAINFAHLVIVCKLCHNWGELLPSKLSKNTKNGEDYRESF